MSEQVALTHTRSVTTECLTKPDIRSYFNELLQFFKARISSTSKDVGYKSFEQVICYDHSGQEPIVPVEGISSIQEAINPPQVSERNLQAIRFLDKWFAEPDDLGIEFWEEFDKELKANRFSIS